MTTTTERWGLRGTGWHAIRHIPRGEDVARAWARSLSSGRDAQTITLYRDNGDGEWLPVETFTPAEVSA